MRPGIRLFMLSAMASFCRTMVQRLRLTSFRVLDSHGMPPH